MPLKITFQCFFNASCATLLGDAPFSMASANSWNVVRVRKSGGG